MAQQSSHWRADAGVHPRGGWNRVWENEAGRSSVNDNDGAAFLKIFEGIGRPTRNRDSTGLERLNELPPRAAGRRQSFGAPALSRAKADEQQTAAEAASSEMQIGRLVKSVPIFPLSLSSTSPPLSLFVPTVQVSNKTDQARRAETMHGAKSCSWLPSEDGTHIRISVLNSYKK